MRVTSWGGTCDTAGSVSQTGAQQAGQPTRSSSPGDLGIHAYGHGDGHSMLGMLSAHARWPERPTKIDTACLYVAAAACM